MTQANSIALIQTAQKEQLYQKLVTQLQKDFTLANIDIELSADTESSQLKIILHEKIYYLLLEKFHEYLNLLYIIDVPEKAFREIHMTDAVEVAEQATFLVLNRELQKVQLKAKHS